MILTASMMLQVASVAFALMMLRHSTVRLPWLILAAGLIVMAGYRVFAMFKTLGYVDVDDGQLAQISAVASLVISALFFLALPAISRISFEEKRAATARREVEQQLAMLINYMPAKIYIKDLRGRYVMVNQRFLQFAQYPLEKVIGQTDRQLFPGMALKMEEEDREVLRTERAVTHDLPIDHAGQRFDFLTTKFPLFDTDGKIRAICGVSTNVAPLKAAQDSLRDTAERLRLGMLAGDVGTWDWDIVANRVVWSDRIYAFHGLRTDQFAGTAEAFNALIHTEDQKRVGDAIERAVRERTPYQIEFRTLRPDGQIRWLTTTGQAFYNEAGTAVRMMGATTDITERKKLSDELLESQRFVGRVLSTTPDLVYVFDVTDRKLTYKNRNFRTFLGYGEVLDRPGDDEAFIIEALHPEDQHMPDGVAARFNGTDDGTTHEIQFRLMHADGTYHWLAARETVFTRGADGNVRQILGTAEDVTARRNAEEERDRLQARERSRSQHLVQVASASLAASAAGLSVKAICDIVIDRARSIIGSHHAMITLPADDDAVGAIHSEQWSKQHPAAPSASMGSALRAFGSRVMDDRRSARLSQSELALTLPRMRKESSVGDTTALRGLLAVPMIGRHGRCLGVIQLADKYEGEFSEDDQTILSQLASIATNSIEAARQMDEVRNARADAEQANAAKDRFLAVLSHELRTPLNPVLMTVSAMAMDPSLPEPVRDDLGMIRRNIDLEVRLIDDLLDLGRIRNGKLRIDLRPTNVHALIEQVQTICHDDLVQRHLRVETNTAAEHDIVTGDPARLQQVLWNLLKNAVKFTRDGGWIRIRTSNPQPGTIEVVIEDDGMGIAPDILPRLFNAFEQGPLTESQQLGGLGLGLAITKAIVDIHKGSVRAESEGENKGARFIVQLPLSQTIVPVVEPKMTTESPTGEKRRLLLVEDHIDTCKVLSRLLQIFKYDVTMAHDIASAKQELEKGSFDLLVSDVGLPDGEGYDLMRHAREKYQLKGICMTGYGMDEDLRKSRDAGFTEHVVKPVDAAKLKDAIARVIDGTLPE